MLRLSRLEISGFKSFVDPVTLDFGDGITAIVGPNGCGKSNLADALAWALGEQSARFLRSGTMDDVIFNGAQGRKALGMAEVQVTLSNGTTEPEKNGDIVIGRRVFRSGESQYRLNGKTVRLKDVQDVLMDTGLGTRTYSVIEQGKISLILSGNVQERRRLLEEAAGITRYKTRRHVATLKLQDAQANLERLDDIILEVERSHRSLRRQAGAAKRYESQREELSRFTRLVLAARVESLRDLLGELDGQIGEHRLQLETLDSRLKEKESLLATGRIEREALAQELNQLQDRESRFLATVEGRQEFLKGARRTIGEIGERLESGRQADSERRRNLEETKNASNGAGERYSILETERDLAAEAVARDDAATEAAQRDVREAEARVEDLQRQLVAALDDINDHREKVERLRLDRERGAFRQGRLTDELTTATQEEKAAASALEKAKERTGALRSRLELARSQEEDLRKELSSLLSQEETLGARARELDDKRARIEQRLEFLAQLEEAQVLRRRLLGEKLEELGWSSVDFLTDALEAPAGWEKALDLYLTALQDAVLVPEKIDLSGLVRKLSAAGVPAALVRHLPPVVPATGGAGEKNPCLEEPGVLASLAGTLGLPEGLTQALPPAYLVESLDDALRLACERPEAAWIVADGVWAQGGTLHVHGQTDQPGALGRKRERDGLARRLPGVKKELEDTRASLTNLVAERTTVAQRLQNMEAGIQEIRRELAVADARQEDVSLTAQQTREQRLLLAADGAALEKELRDLDELLHSARERLAERETEQRQKEQVWESARDRVEVTRQNRENLRAEGAGRRGQLVLLEERLRAQQEEKQRLTHKLERLEAEIQEWQGESDRLAARTLTLGEEIDSAEAALSSAQDAKEELQVELTRVRETTEKHREKLRGLEGVVLALQEDRDGARDRVEALRVEKATRDQELLGLHRQYREECGEDVPQELPSLPEPLESLEEKLAAARTKLERLGPVNLLAAQESEELAHRLEFLTVQREDVARSVESLLDTIREIDETSTRRFLETLKVVNLHFQEAFRFLFRGGEAELKLLDDDDPVDGGFEIVARPPGKRLQSISLLSGGEKALSAIALLVALFRTKPSPFCVLDEVDAPLDDSNVLRFVDIVKLLSRTSQIIVVTHNKLSMEAASTLYGVTMARKGVSSLVAVDMESVQPAAS